jgi:hypothetical protein
VSGLYQIISVNYRSLTGLRGVLRGVTVYVGPIWGGVGVGLTAFGKSIAGQLGRRRFVVCLLLRPVKQINAAFLDDLAVSTV